MITERAFVDWLEAVMWDSRKEFSTFLLNTVFRTLRVFIHFVIYFLLYYYFILFYLISFFISFYFILFLYFIFLNFIFYFILFFDGLILPLCRAYNQRILSPTNWVDCIVWWNSFCLSVAFHAFRFVFFCSRTGLSLHAIMAFSLTDQRAWNLQKLIWL